MKNYESLINDVAERTVDRLLSEAWEIAYAKMEEVVEENGLELTEEEFDELVSKAADRVCFNV
jgi:hypothetical protein